jgi:predicted nucleotidyltransferase
MSTYSKFGVLTVLIMHIITTVNQRVLSFLVKFSDNEFYERQVARILNISYGSANRSLNNLYSTGALKRRQEGKMYFYSIDTADPSVIELKKLVNFWLLEPLVEKLKEMAVRLILYGSCARGNDTSQSDFDLFVVTTDGEKAAEIINGFSFPDGFKHLHIQPVIKSPVDLIQISGSEKTFIEEVEQGTVLWEKADSESRI